jgi:adenosylmethionine-8-amino-7-oxononanoate aminotransferase
MLIMAASRPRTATVSTAIAWLQADYQWPGPAPMSRVLHRTLFADPMLATRGEGIYLHAAAGRKIIDGSGGSAVACLGHGHPRINAAITEQLSKVAYLHTALFTTQAAEELAETTVDGKHGDHLCIAPPNVATPSDVDTIVERLRDAVDDAIAGLPKSS